MEQAGQVHVVELIPVTDRLCRDAFMLAGTPGKDFREYGDVQPACDPYVVEN